MEVKQIYAIVNGAHKEVTGATEVLQEDLSNIVDVGDEIINNGWLENYTRKLVDHIGRTVFVNRKYRGGAPSVLMDAWEYGSIMEKISAEAPNATENESWELTDGASYDPNIFYAPKVTAKFFNKRVTFEINMSFLEKQVKSAFSNATQLNAFISMLYTSVENSLTVKMDSLVMRTINNMTAETMHSDFADDLSFDAASGVRAVNLLYLYKEKFGGELTAADALTDPDFIRFASFTMGNYVDRMAKISTLFNIGGKERFTPRDSLHIVMLSDFSNAADVYLQSDVFHEKYTELPAAETVPYWQGSGVDYAFDAISEINVKTASGNEVNATGILCVMFDRNALGVTNVDRRVTTNYNARAEFYTNFHKFDAGYFNDQNENFVVFFVA